MSPKREAVVGERATVPGGEFASGDGGKQRWWARRDLNPQPRDYESPALTVELQARFLDSRAVLLSLRLAGVQPVLLSMEKVTYK